MHPLLRPKPNDPIAVKQKEAARILGVNERTLRPYAELKRVAFGQQQSSAAPCVTCSPCGKTRAFAEAFQGCSKTEMRPQVADAWSGGLFVAVCDIPTDVPSL